MRTHSWVRLLHTKIGLAHNMFSNKLCVRLLVVACTIAFWCGISSISGKINKTITENVNASQISAHFIINFNNIITNIIQEWQRCCTNIPFNNCIDLFLHSLPLSLPQNCWRLTLLSIHFSIHIHIVLEAVILRRPECHQTTNQPARPMHVAYFWWHNARRRVLPNPSACEQIIIMTGRWPTQQFVVFIPRSCLKPTRDD